VRVIVKRMESIKDSSGNLGKKVELVQEDQLPAFAIRPPSEEARMVQNVFKAFQQQIPMLGVRNQTVNPKIILFLTEQEYESLGVRFEINQIYDIELSLRSLRFKKIIK
jgi:hypothetical protein